MKQETAEDLLIWFTYLSGLATGIMFTMVAMLE